LLTDVMPLFVRWSVLPYFPLLTCNSMYTVNTRLTVVPARRPGWRLVVAPHNKIGRSFPLLFDCSFVEEWSGWNSLMRIGLLQ
jgi:hypothetical protein